MSHQLANHRHHTEAAYRRGYHQGINAALDAAFEHRLTRAECNAWEEAIAAWRNTLAQNQNYQEPPSSLETGVQINDQSA